MGVAMKERLIGIFVLAGVIFAGLAFYEIVAMAMTIGSGGEPTYFNKGPQDSTETH